MNPLVYFGLAILAGIITSLSCALSKMLGSDSEKASEYPDSGSIDNKITAKRIIWLVVWLLQGVIGGLIVSFFFADQVFKNDLSPGFVWTLAFLAGSVSWLDFKKSVNAIKEMLKLGQEKV